MTERIVVVMMAVGLCAAMAHGVVGVTGDVAPADPATWTSSTEVTVGATGVGSVAVDDDSDVATGYSYMGSEAGSTGSVTVSGTGSTWTNASVFNVGERGDGTVDVTSGGSVSTVQSSVGVFAGATGAVTVSGVGSTWTDTSSHIIGYYGDGTMDITNGGNVSVNDGYVGYKGGSTGVATVTGVGSTWTNSNAICVGFYDEANGELNITNGGVVTDGVGNIGFQSGSTGVVTVTGPGSTWTNSVKIYVGNIGSGTLNITNDGLVEVGGYTYVGQASAINFDNGTLTTGSLQGAATDLKGTGTVNTHGLVSDVDLAFDATHGTTQTLAMNGPEQNVTVNLDVDGSGSLGAGYSGNSSMRVADGVAVQSADSYLGYRAGSSGAATVTGEGSTWDINQLFYVGMEGNGTLEITDGGTVDNSIARIGHLPGSTGAVTVSDPGSTWTSSHLYVGREGDGTMLVANGGRVNSLTNYIGYASGATGVVTVSGAGTIWDTHSNAANTNVGWYGDGTLIITDGATVYSNNSYIGRHGVGSVEVSGAGSVWKVTVDISVSSPYGGHGTMAITDGGLVRTSGTDTSANSYITMATGGMLAINNCNATTISELLNRVSVGNDILYWDDAASGWANIADATAGTDYTLTYVTEGYLAHHTILTVMTPIPEPATMSLLALGACLPLFRRKRR